MSVRDEHRTQVALHAVAVAGALFGLGIATAAGNVALAAAFVSIGVLAGHLLAIFAGWVDVHPVHPRRNGEVVITVTADTSKFRQEMAALERRAEALSKAMDR